MKACILNNLDYSNVMSHFGSLIYSLAVKVLLLLCNPSTLYPWCTWIWVQLLQSKGRSAADYNEAQHMLSILNNFCTLSGQTPNWAKSFILFSRHVDDPTKACIQQTFPVQQIDSSTIHLGHPLIIAHKQRSKAYEIILSKFRAKLTTVKANKLNHARRLAYINSVLNSIPIHYMANILFTKKFIAKINAIIRNFWWVGI